MLMNRSPFSGTHSFRGCSLFYIIYKAFSGVFRMVLRAIRIDFRTVFDAIPIALPIRFPNGFSHNSDCFFNRFTEWFFSQPGLLFRSLIEGGL